MYIGIFILWLVRGDTLTIMPMDYNKKTQIVIMVYVLLAWHESWSSNYRAPFQNRLQAVKSKMVRYDFILLMQSNEFNITYLLLTVRMSTSP